MPDTSSRLAQTSTPGSTAAAPVAASKPAPRWRKRLGIGLGALAVLAVTAALLFYLELTTLWHGVVVVASVGAVLSGLAGYWNTYRTVKAAVPQLAEVPAAVVPAGNVPAPPAEAPAPAVRAVPHNVPAAFSPIVGRQAELQALRALMREQRLITLKAMGGIGKTRLALELLREVLAEPAMLPCADGIWFVDLAAIADNALVPNAVLAELSIKTEPERAPLQTLTDALRGRQLLVLLDNCEQVLDGVAQLAATLLAQCPGVRLLCTSREVLNIAGETVYSVPTLTEQEAITLFEARARAVRPGFSADAGNRDQLAQLARRLDGISLAIELAAARMRNLSLGEIIQLLDNRFAVLTGGSRTALPRQQTLHALIDWSHNLLSEPEQVLFRRLAVFNGDFPLQHATAICCALAPLQPHQALDLVGQLVDKSLLMADLLVDAGVGGTREQLQHYHLFESMRVYAQEKLLAAGENFALHQAHARFYAEQAERARVGFEDEAEWPQWLARLRPNHSNYRAAMQWALAEGHDLVAGTMIATGLLNFWVWSGMNGIALHWQELALRQADAHPEAVPALLRARLQSALGGTYLDAGRLNDGATLFRAAIAQFEQEPVALQDLEIACNDLAVIEGAAGNHAAGAALLERAVAIAQQLGNDKRYAEATGNLAASLASSGHIEQAEAVLARLMAQLGERLPPLERLTCARNLALYALVRGDTAAAKTWADRALALVPELGDVPDNQAALVTGMRVEAALGQWPAAAALAQQVLAIFERQPQSRFKVLFGDRMALLAELQGQTQLAARWWGLAARVVAESGVLLPTVYRSDRDASLRRLAARLGPQALARLTAEGEALTWDVFAQQVQQYCQQLLGAPVATV